MTQLATALFYAVMFALNADGGYLSAYDRTPTDATIAYRESVGDLPPGHEYDVYVAALSCDRIGQTMTLHTTGGSFAGIVFDCAGDDGGYSWMRENNMIAEVDWYFWQQYPALIGQWAYVTWGE